MFQPYCRRVIYASIEVLSKKSESLLEQNKYNKIMLRIELEKHVMCASFMLLLKIPLKMIMNYDIGVLCCLYILSLLRCLQMEMCVVYLPFLEVFRIVNAKFVYVLFSCIYCF